jgi:tetratricopeptide (TPR) repeat protein
MGLNKGHTVARNLKSAILRKLGCPGAEAVAKESYDDDKLDLLAKLEYSHFANIEEEFAQYTIKPENFLDCACDYMAAGLWEDALNALGYVTDYPLAAYYEGYCLHKLGRDGSSAASRAEAMDTGYCFPNRLEDIAVLRYAIEACGGANACYYLGCLFYDRFRYEEAADLWQRAVEADPKHGKAWRNLALYWFDKAGSAAKARFCMEKALEHKGDDPRLLLEYEQLLKNSGASIAERLAVYEQYPELLKHRDDCYLDRLTLISQQGRYADAIELARVKRFHIYEGGEGKLTKQHAWMHVLYGLELAKAGKTGEAEAIYLNGVNMPKSYGEAKTFFNQEAHIYYCLGLLTGEAAHFEKAAEYKAAVSEISAFRALALKKLGQEEAAAAVTAEMHAAADNLIENCDLRTYYGVGSPSPMPFEYNIEKQNRKAGYSLKAFAYFAEGKQAQADACMEKAAAVDANDFAVYTYRRLKTLL